MRRYISLLFAIVLTATPIYAQTNKEVKVISNYKPQLSKGEKINKLPVLVDTTRQNVNFSYMITPYPINNYHMLNDIDLFYGESESPSIKGEILEELDGGYFKVAGGNYSTYFGEFVFNNKRSKFWDWGIYLKHGSSNGKVKIDEIGKQRTGFGNTGINLYTNRFIDDVTTASISVSYDVRKHRNYLFDKSVLAKNDKQKFNDLKVKLGFDGVYKYLEYNTWFVYNNFKDKLAGYRENIFVGGAGVETKLFKNITELNFSIEHISQNFNRDYTTLNLNPHYKISAGQFFVDIGLGVSLKTGIDKNVFVYPETTIKYAMVKDIMCLYLFANGGINNNTYRDVAKENPFAVIGPVYGDYFSPLHIYDSGNVTAYTKYNVGIGFKGQFSHLISYNLSTSYKAVDNLGLYYNMGKGYLAGEYVLTNFTQFFDDAKVFNIKAEIDVKVDENLCFLSIFNYYNYSLDILQNPFYKPEAELNLRASYKFNSKLNFGTELEFIGERYASSFSKLEPYMLLNLDAEYKLTNNIYAFININNLFNTKYEIWNGYQNYRFHVLLGATFSF